MKISILELLGNLEIFGHRNYIEPFGVEIQSCGYFQESS